MGDYVEFAVVLAREAGRMQMERFGDVHTVECKEGIQLVTEVDRACERHIVEEIARRFPDHDVRAEEGTGVRRRSPYTWHIDPLDGTTNYAHGFPFFGVSIALCHEDELIAGAIYDPTRDEMFAAERGAGATLDGRRIRVSATIDLADALLATGFAYVDRTGGRVENVDYFESFIVHARAVRRPGAAAIDLAYVACGRLDGFWEIGLKPWDMAAGALIIREAGGMVTSFDGGRFDLMGTQILASNGRVHQEMIQVLAR